MELLLNRYESNDTATAGAMSLDGEQICFTLEDEYREVKKKHHTRIPAGRYEVGLRTEGGTTVQYQNRYGKMHRGMLEIKDVPGFKYILIHTGNTDEDTSGCVLVGYAQPSIVNGEYFLGASRPAYKELYQAVVDAAANGDLWITIEDNDIKPKGKGKAAKADEVAETPEAEA